jgi:glycine/D-amino acid oxidase-like deaminating enzyme
VRAEQVDVAVIGGGIVGLSIALALADERAGKIVVFERSGINAGASGVQPGGVRQQWSTPLNVKLARESLSLYGELPLRLDTAAPNSPSTSEALRFRACGYVFVAGSLESFDDLCRSVAVQNELGVPSEVLSPRELAQIVPGLDVAQVIGGSACAADGYFDQPQAVVEAVALAATTAGAQLRLANVNRLEPTNGSWLLRLADGSTARAGTVVVAAHIDSVDLLRSLDVDFPLTAEDRYLFLSEPIRERLIEPLVVAVDWHFATKHLASGRVLASYLTAAGDPDDEANHWREEMRRTIHRLVPILSYVDFPVLIRGVYDMTPDAQPIVGRVPGYSGLWIAAGFNGRGFMLAPAIGRRLAHAMLTGRSDDVIEDLSAERFYGALAEREGQVV